MGTRSELADAQFRPLEIAQDADRVVRLALDGADLRVPFTQILV